MWWIPAIMVGAYVIKKLLEDDNRNTSQRKKLTILEENFIRLKSEINSCCPSYNKIAIIGQTGAGKSTLLDTLSNGNCNPRPTIGQQTDATNWSINKNFELFHKYQSIMFVDTPGYDTQNHPISNYINYFPFIGFDYLVFLIKGKIHEADEILFKHCVNIFGHKACEKLIIVRSFSEDLTDLEKKSIEKDFKKKFNIINRNIRLVFLSNRNKSGLDELRRFISL